MNRILEDLFYIYLNGKVSDKNEHYNEAIKKMEHSLNKMSECLTPEEYKHFGDYQQACAEVDLIAEKEMFAKAFGMAIQIILESMRSA